MLQKTRAIILHTLRYGDSSLIVHAYTEQWGRTTFLLKGARKSRKSNRSAMFQPLYLLDLDIYYRDNREMHWIREATFSESVPGMRQDVVKATQAIFLSEVLLRTIREEERNPDLFGFLLQSLAHFESVASPSPSFHLVFLFHYSRYLGFYPMNNFSETNLFFNISAGSFSSTPDGVDLDMEKRLGQQWKSCFECEYSSADQHFNNHDKRNMFLDSLLEFYRNHQPSMTELKSLEVLRTVFG